jgi:hypothetical protein
MPSIKDTFDKNKYDSMIRSTNYTGALNYLTELQNGTDDYDEKKALQPFVSTLRQRIHRDESMTRHATDNSQIQQYYFLDAIRTGNSIKGNTYYDQYAKALSGLGNTYDANGNVTGQANQLEFAFNSQKTFNKFLTNMGINEQQMAELNVLVGSNNGKKTIMINKSNPQFYNIIDKIYNTQGQLISEQPLTVVGGDGMFAMKEIDRRDATTGIYYKSYDNRGRELSKYGTLYDGKFNRTMVEVEGLINSAERNYKNLETLATQDLAVSSFSLPWKTAAHARADELLATTGDTEEYNKTIQRLDGQLTGALVGLNLGQQNVWATGDADDPNYHQLTPEEKIAYQQILRDAIRDGRIGTSEDKLGGVRMAMLGDKFGYQIDILPKSDSKGLFSMPWDNSNIHRTIFIENPWPEENMTQAFESRTEFQAMKELILMNQYKYPFDMDDGSVLEMTSELGGIYKKDGVEQVVDRRTALNLLNENFIKVRGAEALQSKYKPNKPKNKYNIENFENAMDADAWAYALSAAEELVPKENKQAYMDKVYDLYHSILNKAGYKGKRAITIKVEE